MVSVRDLKVAIATSVVVVAGMSFTKAQATVLSSRIFDWDSLKVVATKVGFRRDVVRSPTAEYIWTAANGRAGPGRDGKVQDGRARIARGADGR